MKTPEEMAIEWLREEYGDTSNWTYMGQEMSLDAFHAGYQAAKDQFADSSKVMPQWISVKDRLPEIGEWVLINDPEVCQRVAPPSSNWDWEFAWATDHQSFYEPTDITHWMPLPKPPEGK